MDTALVKLLWLRLRGGLRQRFQELKTRRRMLLLLAIAAVVLLLFKLSVFTTNNPLADLYTTNPQQLRVKMAQFMPVSLLGAFVLTTLVSPGPGLYFSPTEINLLFSAPFPRRTLLIYKLCCYAFGVLLSSLLIMVLTPASVIAPSANFIGTFLTLLFIQLLTVATGLLGQVLPKLFSARFPCRYLMLALLLLVVTTGYYYVSISNGLKDALIQFQASLGGILLLALFQVLTHIFLAQAVFPDLLLWATIGFTMNIVLIVAVILLDAQSCEASTASSLERHKHWERMRRTGLLWGENPVMVRTFIPVPVLAGIGPFAWRQLLSAFRCSSKVLSVFMVMAALAGPLLIAASADISKWSLIGTVFFVAVFVLPKSLVFDFRSDLESMENFKMLPLSAWKICIGQLFTSIVLTSLIEMVLLVSTAISIDSQWRVVLLGISPFLLPFNILLYELENLFFLLFPAPLVPVGRADFDFLGRTLLEFVIKSSILMGSCFLAAKTGQLLMNTMAWSSWLAFGVLAWLTLSLIALLVLPLLSWSFNRFDVSRS